MTAVTLTQMHMVAADEADRIDTVQTVLVRDGDLKAPDPGQMHKMLAYRGICRLIDKIYADPVVLERLRNPPKAGSAAA
jgi:hypothetical protein